MKTLQLVIITLWLSTLYAVSSAQDMSGEWNGMITQNPGGAALQYYFTLNLQQNGSQITGISKVSFVDRPEYFGTMELRGTFTDDILTFEELKIVNQKVFAGLEWCLKKAKLNFTIKRDGFCIEGSWAGTTPSGVVCSPGRITLCKIVPIAQNVDFLRFAYSKR